MTPSIDVIQPDDIEELEVFARPFEHDILQRYPALPLPEPTMLQESLRKRLENGVGVMARQRGDTVGCLAVVGPFSDFRPGVSGVYAPLFSCLAQGTGADHVFTTMLTELGRVSGLAGVGVAAFTCPTNDSALNHSLGQNGFGVRCADSVVSLSDLPPTPPDIDFVVEEIAWPDAVLLLEVKRSLGDHLASSPMFMERFDFSPEFVARKSEERQSTHFAARDGDRYIGYIEATFDGENYLTRSPQMRNICGAGVLPEYRNRGIMQALLVHLANHYRSQGVQALGVDYETLNPSARGFWERHFTPYTWSWERRFDMTWDAS